MPRLNRSAKAANSCRGLQDSNLCGFPHGMNRSLAIEISNNIYVHHVCGRMPLTFSSDQLDGVLDTGACDLQLIRTWIG